MRSSLIVASFGAALTALAAGISPVNAEPVSSAYPYCLMGRGGGSTTCYFKSRADCGNGCINNPGYVGDVRARAILAGAGIAGDNATVKPDRVRPAPTAARAIGAVRPKIDAGARASAAGFEGWPTDYLVNRFGDRQAQGRF